MIIPLAATIIAFLAVTLFIYSIYSLTSDQQRLLADRLQRHTDAPTGAAKAVTTTKNGAALLIERGFSSIDALDQVLKTSTWAERAALDLSRAGVPLRVGEYLLMRWLIAATLFALPTFVFNMVFLVGLVLGIIGFYIPRFYVSRKENQRIKKFNDQLVDTLTMLANAMKSGSSFLQGADLVARELPEPIGTEFARLVAETNIGGSIENGLLAMTQRVRSYDLYLVVTATLVQREVGGNLSEVLNNIANTIRERQKLLRQAEVSSAEERLSGYVVGGLPIFIMLMMLAFNPDYLDVLLHTGMGQLLLVGAALLEILGFYVIRRMVNVDI